MASFRLSRKLYSSSWNDILKSAAEGFIKKLNETNTNNNTGDSYIIKGKDKFFNKGLYLLTNVKDILTQEGSFDISYYVYFVHPIANKVKNELDKEKGLSFKKLLVKSSDCLLIVSDKSSIKGIDIEKYDNPKKDVKSDSYIISGKDKFFNKGLYLLTDVNKVLTQKDSFNTSYYIYFNSPIANRVKTELDNEKDLHFEDIKIKSPNCLVLVSDNDSINGFNIEKSNGKF